MANMLIRTKQCKTRLTVLIRVILFFGIPLFYFVFLRDANADNADSIASRYNDEPDAAATVRFLSRRLQAAPEGLNCTPPAILEFPPDGFTRAQRQHGFIIIHCVIAVYCFLLLAMVCEQYFVPAIEIICERLNMASDIAGATFMAAASSSPELFINCVGTFVTEGDLGVGAIVGSAVFNVLAVPACCALVAGRAIELDWWSVSRDCLMYAVAVVVLILTLLDDRVYWHEALLLVLMYTLYILAMVFNGRLGSFARSGCCYFNKPKMYTEVTPLLIQEKTNQRRMSRLQQNDLEQGIEMTKRHDSTGSDNSTSSGSVWSFPGEKSSVTRKLLWVLGWPISLVLWATVPDCRRHPRVYPLTFLMCVAWIGGVSYLVAWLITVLVWPISLVLWSTVPDCRRHPRVYPLSFFMYVAWIGGFSYLVAWLISVLGDTLDVPDSITGLTILAAGTSLPEAVSSVLVTNHGHGTMGISNSIGSNTFDILLCLGLPWLIKSLFYPTTPGHHWVSINSSGLSYSAISLLSTLLTLYGALTLNKFQLDWKIGLTCSLVYVGYLILAALIELNVLFVVNLPVCPH